MNEIPLKQVIEASLEKIRNVLDADTVVGTPITVSPDITIIPISKVSCGFTSGGVDYDSKVNPKREMAHFGGANAAGLTVTPLTFLVIQGNDVRVMNINGTTASSESSLVSTLTDLVDKSPVIFSKIRSLFDKDKKKADEKKLAEEITEKIEEQKEKE